MRLIKTSIFIILFPTVLFSQNYIADYKVAKEEVLRKIPSEYIYKARNNFKIAYQHTSHGTHVARGLFGLPDYKAGDDTLFSITNNNPTIGKLDFRDYAISSYALPGIDASDLSRNEKAFIQTTRNFLDSSVNAEINVIMWSWCDISGHYVTVNYLPGMDSLLKEYGVGGSKIGSGPGQRKNPVTFIFMTGHANADYNVGGVRRPKVQADTIKNFCKAREQFCLDYFTIDTYDMDDNYWEDAGDNGNSTSYGGNYYEDWQNSHALGINYYENKMSPGGSVIYGAHNTQHITANRKAFAMWWILARMAGWDGDTSNTPGIFVDSLIVKGAGGESTITTDEGSLQMTATVLPANASNQTVTWHVDFDSIAEISSNGLLTAKQNGDVTVTATAADGSGISGSTIITVSNQVIEVESITVKGTGGVSTISADNGSLQMTATVLPVNASNQTVTWHVDFDSIADITSDGLLTAKQSGNVTVTATATDGSGISGSTIITVSNNVIEIESITVEGTDGVNFISSDDGSLQMTATILPANASNQTVTWHVDIDSIADITSDGLLTAKQNGNVTVTATAADGSGISGSTVILVTNQVIKVESITVEGTGGVNAISTDDGSLQMTATILPANASDQNITWHVNSDSIAVISSTGLLTAKRDGSVIVTAIANDGSEIFGTVTVTITNQLLQIIHIEGIKVYGKDGLTSISGIGGSLQIIAEINPINADNSNVIWEVINVTGQASISTNGLLTAEAKGEVFAKAVSEENPEIADSVKIEIIDTVNSISDNINSQLKVFPNPFTDNLHIDINTDNKKGIDAQIYISSLDGIIRYIEKVSQSFVSINMSSFKAGVYNLSIIENNKTTNLIIIKK